MDILQKFYNGVELFGLYGVLKSTYYSFKFSGSFTDFLVHKNVITDVSPNTNFDINEHIIVGATSHPKIATGKFSSSSDSSIVHTGKKGAQIGAGCLINIRGDFSMGDSFINEDVMIVCGDKITIGDGCAISWGVTLRDDDMHQIEIDGHMSPKTKPIEIQDNVWIGHDVTVGKGVTINSGSVVASNSVVVSDVPPNSLVAGNPAEVVRDNVDWEI